LRLNRCHGYILFFIFHVIRTTKSTKNTKNFYKTIRLIPVFMYFTLKFISRPIRIPDNFIYVNN
jgi:hypothetical protein